MMTSHKSKRGARQEGRPGGTRKKDSRAGTGQSALLSPVAPPRNLTHAIFDRLAGEILGGRMAPGARLPTEQEMVRSMGVSRTVVREAVAALRAEGLVVTRQGIGAFVAGDVQRRPFRIDPEGLRSIDEVVEIMELRMGIEIESAGLAAERAGPNQLRAIEGALSAIDRTIASGGSAVDEDFRFHQAIAAATHNAQYVRLLEFLGRFIIPRQSVRVTVPTQTAGRAYLDLIQDEHRAIFAAIQRAEPDAARKAMRRHLANGRDRYRRLAAAPRRRT